MQYLANQTMSEYWLNDVYTQRIRDAVDDNLFHIHDLGYLSAYCSGWSVEDVLVNGFGGVADKIQCKPPNHFNTALNQLVNFLFTLQGELAGAQALSNFDTYMAPFIRHDQLNYNDVFKYVQSFVYSLNVPTRAGFQAPFTNVSMDIKCPSILKGVNVIIGGERHSTLVYEDFQDEMDIFNRAFSEVMLAGDGNGSIFSFPIPTYNLVNDLDSVRYKGIWEMTAKYGSPYFANFINSDLNPDDFRSMCCRLRLDTRKLHAKRGGLFGSTPLTGSIGVVTLNLPNLAIRANINGDRFENLIENAIDVAKESLEIKRKFIDEHESLYPFASRYLHDIKQRTGSCWTNHFSTIGVIGMNEAIEILKGTGIYDNQEYALTVLDFIKAKLQQFQNETGHLYNMEATPAESTCYKLAKRDKEIFHGISIPEYYTNSTALPVNATTNVFDALSHQEALQQSYTGGTVFHAYVGERFSKWENARDMAKIIATNYKIPYFSLTPTFSVCKKDGYINGEHFTCPKCGEESLVYSRIVGYYRPVQMWNTGKKKEFVDRQYYEDFKLPISGFTEQSFIDYPGEAAAVMFTSRCNLACPWCHNGGIVKGEIYQKITPQEIIQFMTSHPGLKLVITGGEPTIHGNHLLSFMRTLKKFGIGVKLDTNGTHPELLKTIVDENLAEFIAMDVKGSLSKYDQIVGKKIDTDKILSSVEIVKTVKHQFRMTYVPDICDIEDITNVRKITGGEICIQKFRNSPTILSPKQWKEQTDDQYEKLNI